MTSLWDPIRQKLFQAFSPCEIEIKDLSPNHQHHHESNPKGGIHGVLILKSPLFNDKDLKERHRMVYEVLREEFDNHTLHALSMTLLPKEH